MKKIKSQKGFAGNAIMAVLILVVVGVFLTVSVSIFDNISAKHTSSTTVVNESVAMVNGTASSLGNNSVSSITQIGNASITIGSANITSAGSKDGSTVTVTMITSSNDDIFGGTYDVTYIYALPDNVNQVSENATAGLMEFAMNYELLGLIVILGIILGALAVYLLGAGDGGI